MDMLRPHSMQASSLDIAIGNRIELHQTMAPIHLPVWRSGVISSEAPSTTTAVPRALTVGWREKLNCK